MLSCTDVLPVQQVIYNSGSLPQTQAFYSAFCLAGFLSEAARQIRNWFEVNLHPSQSFYTLA